MKKFLYLLLLFLSAPAVAERCLNPDLEVVVLGSGGPELPLLRGINMPQQEQRASTGYLLREKGKAKFIIDLGSGTLLNFERAGARIEDLQAILLSHLHVDHINDLPALIKASFFTARATDLPIYGPTGNHLIPDTGLFLQRLFGEEGAYAYLSGFVRGEESYSLQAHNVNADKIEPKIFTTRVAGFKLQAVGVEHGLMPALGWRIEKDGCALVVSGDTSNLGGTLDPLVRGANLFIAHNAVPESSGDAIALKLHMPPSEIGRIARQAGVDSLILSHIMRRTENVKPDTEKAIRGSFKGKVAFARDCDIFSLQSGRKIGSCKK
ncbi:ribonuclease BN (tRNA processing enzyme) [Mesocricetibacter intestinalis]|uniref:Ribonuclease BN (tRNA processing enzyme) n=1 Tax=Mesocricetibacter intestinalis TaxID=1521930 RepID=A0A4R6VFF7_9PAST|nr:MBL fold metallo-hydrolase [Mesocricetibacter intestinalis]TDQ59725.1 ribonuclease BN (tRNA processing enzyme) [Mesocricetibacter intestinalis]